MHNAQVEKSTQESVTETQLGRWCHLGNSSHELPAKTDHNIFTSSYGKKINRNT